MPEPSSILPNYQHRYPDWQNELEAALIETDHRELPRRLEEAETAIFTRWHSLMDDPDAAAERQALVDATHKLRTLAICELNYPPLGM